jgi:hypothetical protein
MMAGKPTKEDFIVFKETCVYVEEYMRKKQKLLFKIGLCHEIASVANLPKQLCYDTMDSFLKDEEFSIGLGPNGEYNTDRRVFMEFLAFVLSEEDMLELYESAQLGD